MVHATAPPSSREEGSVRTSPPPRTRRPLWSRFSVAHGLMVGSGLLAFVLVATALGERDAAVRVAVARDDIPAGAAVSADQLRWTELPADSELAGQFVSPADIRGASWVATQPVASGQPLLRQALSSAHEGGLRWISIPVAREHAAGGALRVGDRVDIIDVVNGTAVYVVSGAEVAKVAPGAAGRGLTGGTGRGFFVVVRVEAEQALAIAQALEDGKLEVVRSTSASPVAAAPRLAPYAVR